MIIPNEVELNYLQSRRLLLDGLDLLLESLQVLNEVCVLPLKGRDGSGVPAQLVRHGVLFLQDSTQNIFAVVKVLVELSGGLKHLRSETHKSKTFRNYLYARRMALRMPWLLKCRSSIF